MASPYNTSVQGPKSVEEIVKEAQNFDHKSDYPLRIALRTAQNILNQATNYERDGNLQETYLFLYRHAEFCMTKVSTHPDRKKTEFKEPLAKVREAVSADLTKLEALKPELRRRYERYQESVRKRNEARDSTIKSSQAQAAFDGHDHLSSARLLNAGEHSDLALRLAHKELRRRGVSTRAAPLDGVDDLSRGIRELGRRLEHGQDELVDSSRQPSHPSQQYHYPSVPPGQQTSDVYAIGSRVPGSTTPGLPPKDTVQPLSTRVDPPPPRPSKSQVSTADNLQPVPPPKDALSSSSYTFASSAKTEAGSPLRTLFLPTELRSSFLALAASNTASKLETCGILCGTLISNALFISHLVIPDQTSTSDTCETTDAGETALFDYVDGEELMVCGWIHTHPTQTCFLSSRDLHTSVGYQVMLPESVAIVCAPSQKPDHGIFRLTDPPGKQAILNCHQTGLFHPHAQNNLYTDATRPGHVSELAGLQFQVVDLRGK